MMPKQAVLFEPSAEEKAIEAITFLRKALTAERNMRGFVFRFDQAKRDKKVKEMEEALKRVDLLESMLRR
ncbi:MAG: hypothetical protein K6U74_01130 [Firmicutes bacterium]|nr:hypothetical protein [Bacillota bacterium]